MELDLISSMHRAFYFHRKEQIKEGFNWEQWQKSKLRSIEEYRNRNKQILKSYKNPINDAIQRELKSSFITGQNKFVGMAKRLIDKFKHLSGISKGTYEGNVNTPIDIGGNTYKKPPEDRDFFGMNEKKLEALQKSVTADIKKANSSILRKMDDVYRQTIYKSHVYLQSGAVSLNKAIDMATKDFLDKGINSITYTNGSRVNIGSYAEMCLRTANHRAVLLGEGSKRDEWDIHLVVVSAHGNTCPMCEPWQGKVLIDDVFSHPSKEYIDKYIEKYELLSEAIKAGLLHPNCRHNLTTFFEGITSIPKIPDGKEAIKLYEAEQKQRAYERAIRKQKRIVQGTCDEESKEKEKRKLRNIQSELRKLLEENSKLRRNYSREKIDFRSIEEINYTQDLKQYEKYKEVLGKEVPETFDKFQELKYNNTDEWELFKDYAKSRSSNMISAFSSFDDYKKYKDIIENNVVGLTTSNGIKITGQSKHFIERVLGTGKDPKTGRARDGVEISDIVEAIQNGHLRTRKNDPDSVKFISDKCIVSVNPNTGKLIQVNPQ